MRPAVFLDRDGTINEQMGYINHITRFHLLPKVIEALRMLNEQEIPAVVVTNQSGLARGYFPESLLEEVNDRMHHLFASENVHVDGLYICPHHPKAELDQYRVDCNCRKPKIGLLQQAAEDLDLDLSRSYVVGDRWSDLKAAANCNATPVLVLSGYGRGDLTYIGPGERVQPRFVAEDLLEAVKWIVDDLNTRKGRDT